MGHCSRLRGGRRLFHHGGAVCGYPLFFLSLASFALNHASPQSPSHAYTKYLSRMSPGSLFLCVPYTMSATRWETEGYPHTHTHTHTHTHANRMQRLMDGDRREPHARTVTICATADFWLRLGTSTTFTANRISWVPHGQGGGSLARSLAGSWLADSKCRRRAKAKGQRHGSWRSRIRVQFGNDDSVA